VKSLTGEVVTPSPNNMALIYKKVPLYKVIKAWDNNDPNLSEDYKLQSSDLCNKSCIKNHKDNGKYGIEFTINKMIPEFNKGAEKCDLNWSDSFVEFEKCSRATTKQPGNRCFMSTFQSLLMQLGQYQPHKITAWKKLPSSNPALHSANAE
jgi:hypothetical protein